MVIGVARTFLQGLAAGVLGSLVGGLVLVYTLTRLGVMSFSGSRLPDLQQWLEWVYVNLGSSIPVFAILLVAWFVTLQRLDGLLGQEDQTEAGLTNRIVQLDHLTDIWTALFFGTGVIWTAIGMRSALIFALGDPDATLQGGAFAILDRMVRGGILLALSTTIFGGVGGYLMRVYKALSLGSKLQRHYDRAARVDTSEMRESLYRIERHLHGREPEQALDDDQRRTRRTGNLT
ncbi:MAG: hypothetical protein ACN4GT_02930 [Gammaproteobacteria bacterium]